MGFRLYFQWFREATESIHSGMGGREGFEGGGVCSAMTGRVPGPTPGTPPPRVAGKKDSLPTPPMPHAGPLRYRHGVGASGEGDDSGQGDCESRRGKPAEIPGLGYFQHPPNPPSSAHPIADGSPSRPRSGTLMARCTTVIIFRYPIQGMSWSGPGRPGEADQA